MRNCVIEDLLKQASEFNIELEDVSITDINFGKEFTRAVKQKKKAQQDTERACFTVEKVEPLNDFLNIRRSNRESCMFLVGLLERVMARVART
jgi:prohibitin 2